MERAIALLERKLDAGEPPTLAQLAAAAAMSEYHFHRIFRVTTGETVGAAIARVRLGGSLPMLDKGIVAATGRSGYASSQAYARALKEAVGATPSQLRDDPARRDEAATSLARPAAGQGEAALAITITSFAPLRLTALRNIGDYADLNGGFNRLFALLMAQMGPEDITGLYGIPHDDPRDAAPSECRFDCAVTTAREAAADGGISRIEVSGGPALCLDHRGDYDLIHPAIDALYGAAVAADLPVSDAAVLIHYLDDPEEAQPDELRAAIYLPLKADAAAA